MCDGKTYMLSVKGAFRMSVNWDWETKEAPARGLRDPWTHRPNKVLHTEEIVSILEGKEVPSTRITVSEVSPEEYDTWCVERDEHIRQRNEYIALRMLNEYGYDAFLEECEIYNLTEEFKNNVIPCESLYDSQCSLFCPKWDNCERRIETNEN